MPEPAGCLTPDALAAFELGLLPEPELVRIADHLDGCHACRGGLAVLPHAADPLVVALRKYAHAPFPSPAPAFAPTADFPRVPDTSVGGNTDAPFTVASDRPPAWVYDSELPSGLLAPPQKPDELGRLGPYRVLRILGRGGMGLVFEAHDERLNRLVALKVILPARSEQHHVRERFLREARAAAGIEHDHVVPIYHADEDRNVPYIAMPLLKGESLSDRLGRDPRPTLAEAVRIGRQVAEGLAAAQEKGVIHRDIKPANIWLEAPNGRVRILDFGLACGLAEDVLLTNPGKILGTPAYMAPEQAGGDEVDSRADLFALGVVLYELTTGVRPFQGRELTSVLVAVRTQNPPPPHDRNPAVPRRLSDLIMRLLQKEPGHRPATAREVAATLQEVELLVRDASTASVGTPVTGRETRSSWWWVAIAAGLLLAASTAAYQAVVRVEGEKGEILITTDDPSLVVTVKKDGVLIEDPSRKRLFRVVAGRYEVEVTDPATGDKFLAREFTINRGGKEILRVIPLPRPEPPGNEQPNPVQPAPPAATPPAAMPPAAPAYRPPARSTPLPVVAEAAPRDAPDELLRVRQTTGNLAATAVAFSPGGKFAAVGWDNGSTTILDIAGRKPRYHIPLLPSDPPGRVTDLAFGPEDDVLAIVTRGGLLRLVDLETGTPGVGLHHGKGFRRVAFSLTGKSLATSDSLGWVKWWSATNLNSEGKMEGGEPYTFAWVATGVLVLREYDNVPRLYDALTSKDSKSYPPVGAAAPPAKSFLPGGKRVLVGEYRNEQTAGRLRLSELDSGKELWTTDVAGVIDLVAVSADGRRGACTQGGAEWRKNPSRTGGEPILVHDLGTGREVCRLTGHTKWVEALAISPDGGTLLTASADGTARLWKLPSPQGMR